VPKTKANPQIRSKFRLEDQLLLARFIANKIGITNVSEIKEFGEVKEGFDSDGRSYMYHAIIMRRGNAIPEDRLRQYDDNIRNYFENLRRNREERISLKYYQYLALLFSEIYLDFYFQNPVGFLNEINERMSETTEQEFFSALDLKKIAYWMATGSGKTFIMHGNYWQFLAYNKGPKKLAYENIILITPSDEMSKQHLDDFKKSGIPAIMFHGESVGYFEGDKNAVKVISIHKLKLPEDKKGEGVTVDVSSLGTKNLVLVDEGHKGQKSEDLKWKRTRERLAKDGFTFEYSATFGQAITSSNEEIFREYSKAILFDYSYKYFYGDGYGKDFRILNLDTKTFVDSQIPMLLLANTMSFYEQILEYEKAGNSLRDYAIEKPLWIFVGSRVRDEASDILKITQFLNWLLESDEKTIKQHIENILRGNSGIQAEKRDIFTPRVPETNFIYLRGRKVSSEEVYNGIFNEIFHVSPGVMGRKLHLVNLKNAEGEIGLRVGASEKYFGVIYIGEKPEFLKLVQESTEDIPVESATLGKSLFDDISDAYSTINLLIGAKKFIEGWNSWRVSSMCLLNVGKSEGPQIIQLFGRGVRLKGKDYSLKRSRFMPPPNPEHIEILETLQVFGIQANYMQIFKQIIEKEDVPSYKLPLETIKMEPFPQDLQILGLKGGWSFDEELIELKPEDGIDARIDLLPRATIIDLREKQALASTQSQIPKTIKREVLDLLDWDSIYYTLLEYKNERELGNIVITKESLKRIMYEAKYTLLCNDELITPKNFEALEQIEEVVVLILKKYFSAYYSKKRNASEKTHLELKPLENKDQNLVSSYRIQINEDDKVLISKIEELIKSGRIYASGTEVKLISDLRTFTDTNPTSFKNAFFPQHLYQPLLVRQNTDRIVTAPIGLNEGETRFVEDLRDYLDANKSFAYQVYLLRNLTKSRGVGFYESHSFYPDFIMWIKKNEKQTIVFIDPKGLTHLGLDDPKLKLHEYLKEQIQKELKDPNVKLDAFIISVTPYSDMSKRTPGQYLPIENFEKDKHVLFQFRDKSIRNVSYVPRMFEILANN